MSQLTPLPASLITALREARHVAVLTGAGVSAESGIPTFREAQTGLWARFDPTELATPQAFARNPRLVWEWYVWRRQLVSGAEPNPAHLALARLERLVPRLTLITQNVDGLHARAGSSAPIELHGSLARVRCSVEGTRYSSWPDDGPLPPPCPGCGAYLRPDVVWFGEALPEQALAEAWAAAGSCDLLLSIGTSGQVYPAAALPDVAARAGATVAVINLDVATSSGGRLHQINGKAGELLPALLEAAFEQRA